MLRPLTIAPLITAFLALQFLIPARLVIGGMGAAGRPSVVLALLLALIWLAAFSSLAGIDRGPQPVRWIIGAYLAGSLISYAAGYARGLPPIESRAADRWLIATVAMCGLALALCDGIRDRMTLDHILVRLTQFTAVMSIVGGIQAIFLVNLTEYIRLPGLQKNTDLLGISERGEEDLARVAGTANHYVEYGVVLALVLPIAIHYAMVAANRSQAWRRWASALIIAVGIPFSISRAAVVTLACSMAVLALVWPWRTRFKALAIAAAAVVLFQVARPGLIGTIRALFTNLDNDPSVQNRVADYAFVRDHFLARPWVGRGLGTLLPDQYILLDNQFLYTALTGGVVGVATFIVLIVGSYLVCRSVRLFAADQASRHLGQVLAAALIGSFVASGTYDSLSFPTFTGVLFMVIGVAGALWRLDRQSRSSVEVRHPPVDEPARMVAPSLAARWDQFIRAEIPRDTG